MNSTYAKGTKRRYEQSYRVHVKGSWITSIPIGEVDAKTLQDFYIWLPVSKQNLDSINKWMSAFYKWLALNNISGNILSAVTMPEKYDNKKKDEIIVWSRTRSKPFSQSSDGHRLRFMMFLMNYTGLRISECLGLKYSDIRSGFVCVDRQYYQGEIVPPKHNSCRKIPVHPELEKALQIHKERFEAEGRRNKYKTDFVFTSDSGKLLEYGNTRRSLNRYYADINVPQKSPHTYRATFCTELCRAGVPLEVASKLMGHKSIEVTAKHYALVKQDVQIAAINRLPGIDVK